MVGVAIGIDGVEGGGGGRGGGDGGGDVDGCSVEADGCGRRVEVDGRGI